MVKDNNMAVYIRLTILKFFFTHSEGNADSEIVKQAGYLKE